MRGHPNHNYMIKITLHKFFKLFSLIIIAMCPVMLVECTNVEPELGPGTNTEQKRAESTTLVYAIATNSLSRNMVDDKAEMLSAAASIDLEKNNVLLFETSYKLDPETNSYVLDDHNKRVGNVVLQKIVKGEEGYAWETVKEYSTDVPPLKGERMAEIIDAVRTSFPAENYGLIFWSHSSGADPYVVQNQSSTMPVSGLAVAELPSVSWFGQDLTSTDANYTYMNIDDMADVLPDHFFDFIWFDSCYMSNIESIYQLRNKCNKYIGYATEVWEPGLPYDRVLPYLAQREPEIEEAAEIFFNFYDKEYIHNNATIAVTETAALDRLASYCSDFFDSALIFDPYEMERYSRGSIGPFYDLGDYAKELARQHGEELSDEEWQDVLSEFVTYKAATRKDFNNNIIYPERYSGISTHNYNLKDTSDRELYYRSLQWYSRVFK